MFLLVMLFSFAQFLLNLIKLYFLFYLKKTKTLVYYLIKFILKILD